MSTRLLSRVEGWKRRRSTREILSLETDVLPNNESFDCEVNGLK